MRRKEYVFYCFIHSIVMPSVVVYINRLFCLLNIKIVFTSVSLKKILGLVSIHFICFPLLVWSMVVLANSVFSVSKILLFPHSVFHKPSMKSLLKTSILKSSNFFRPSLYFTETIGVSPVLTLKNFDCVYSLFSSIYTTPYCFLLWKKFFLLLNLHSL